MAIRKLKAIHTATHPARMPGAGATQSAVDAPRHQAEPLNAAAALLMALDAEAEEDEARLARRCGAWPVPSRGLPGNPASTLRRGTPTDRDVRTGPQSQARAQGVESRLRPASSRPLPAQACGVNRFANSHNGLLP